jgi:hypothetical protein
MIDNEIFKQIIETGSSAIGIVNKIALNQKLQNIEKKLNELIKKNDQLITREIKASYESINDALLTSNVQTRVRRLDFAEDNLLKNIRLNPALSAEDKPNSYWICLSHFGLSIICTLRDDTYISCKHILHAFEYDGTLSKEILPEFYSEMLEKRVKELESSWYQKKRREINSKDYGTQEFLGKSAAVLLGAGSIVAGILANRPIAAKSPVDEAKKIWNDSDSSSLRSKELNNLEVEKEKRFQIFCRDATLELLNIFNRFPPI